MLNFLNKLSIFIDENIQLIRASIVITGVSGVVLIFKRYHLFSVYTHASEIPLDFVKRKVQLKGIIRSNYIVSPNDQYVPVISTSSNDMTLKVPHLPVIERHANILTLKVQHVPVIPSPINTIRKGNLDVVLAGAVAREGFDNVKNSFLNQPITFYVLARNGDFLHSEAFFKKNWWSRSRSMNEKLVSDGVAIVSPFDISQLNEVNSKMYEELQERLLKLELKREKKLDRQIWKSLNLCNKIKRLFSFSSKK